MVRFGILRNNVVTKMTNIKMKIIVCGGKVLFVEGLFLFLLLVLQAGLVLVGGL